jgi:hypothetical protein
MNHKDNRPVTDLADVPSALTTLSDEERLISDGV